jgi:hypothetical protein
VSQRKMAHRRARSVRRTVRENSRPPCTRTGWDGGGVWWRPLTGRRRKRRRSASLVAAANKSHTRSRPLPLRAITRPQPLLPITPPLPPRHITHITAVPRRPHLQRQSTQQSLLRAGPAQAVAPITTTAHRSTAVAAQRPSTSPLPLPQPLPLPTRSRAQRPPRLRACPPLTRTLSRNLRPRRPRRPCTRRAAALLSLPL